MKRTIAVCCFAIACSWYAIAQTAPSVRIEPRTPTEGDMLTISIELAGPETARVSLPIPSLQGPIAFVESSVRPSTTQHDGGLPQTLATMILQTTGPGSASIHGLSVLIDGVAMLLGSYVIDIAPLPSKPVSSRSVGSWDAPSRLWAYQPFVLRARDSAGFALSTPGLFIRSVVLEPFPQPGAYRALSTTAGRVLLPAAAARSGQDEYRLSQRFLEVLALPPAVDATKAVGQWSVRLSVQAASTFALMGQRVGFEASASGTGSVPWAKGPQVQVFDPDGRRLDVQSLSATDAKADGETWSGTVYSRGSFLLTMAGVYRVQVLPYAYFDHSSELVKTATADPVLIRVQRPELPSWEPSTAQRDFLLTLSSDTNKAHPVLAAASALALQGKRAEGLALGAALSRGFCPPKDAESLADILDESLGTSRIRDSLPPPVWIFAAALCLALFALCAYVLPRPGMRNRSGSVKALVVLFLILCLASACLLAVSLVERSLPCVVSLGAALRSAPSELADMVAISRAGISGRVRATGQDWLFVRFVDGSSGWVQADEVRRY